MTTTDPYAPGGALARAKALFDELDLDLPPIPTPFLALLVARSRSVFSSRPAVDSLVPLDRWLDEAVAGDPPPYLAFGYEGAGVNDRYLRLALVEPGLAAFLELPFGNAYVDEAASRGDVFQAWRSLGRLLAGEPPADGRLVVDHRAGVRSRYRPPGEDDWVHADDAVAAAAVTLRRRG